MIILAMLLPATVKAQVVISQVYAGAGCTAADCSTYKNDYVELFNAGASPAPLGGLSVQISTATGTFVSRILLPTISLQPGQYYLIALADGTGGTSAIPLADAVGANSISTFGAKVVLASTTTLLVGACPSVGVLDLVGYGTTTNCFEANRAPALTNFTAISRASNGCSDTNDNAADFSLGAPSPRNSASPRNPCSLPPPPAPVPTMTEWAMILFGTILAGGAALYIRRREIA